MKLSKGTALSIENILSTVKLIKVADLLITNDKVSGYNPDKTAFIMSELDLDEDFGSIGINRLQTFLSRFNLIKDDENVEITAIVDGDDDDKITKELKFKTKTVNMQYRCGSPKFISVPTVINDNEKYTIKIEDDLANFIGRATSSATTENPKVKIINKDGKLSFELIDDSDDIIAIASEVEVDCEEDSNTFTFSYALDMFNALIKNSADNSFTIGARGIFKIEVNSLTFYMLPRA